MAVDEPPGGATAAPGHAPGKAGPAPEGSTGPLVPGDAVVRGATVREARSGNIADRLAIRRSAQRARPQVRSPESVLHELLAEQRQQLGELHRGWESVHGLLRLVLDAPRSSGEAVEAESFADPTRFGARMRDLAVLCQSELLRLRRTFAAPGDPMEGLDDDLEMLARGVTLRLLVSTGAARSPGAAGYLSTLSDHGAEIRVAATVPLQLDVIDRRVSVFAGEQPQEEGAWAEGTVLRSARLAACFARIFEHQWDVSAAHVRTAPRGDVQEWTPREREVLALLAAGAKDETIARRLGCSERTLRRLLAALVDRLGAESRFAAGVRAARLGLLDGS
ncbi:LuxR C-terminal-related transcriptional regulator [Streptomyces sp. NPDC127068]|uniref:helix-turn-helix transcriptional regulator n=1 Tax=Streptomyces sp. NPDC127068 TaxID=3347127 RepID=UPI0036535F35